MSEETQPVRWGIVGPGSIAGRFADDLARSASGRLVAVGSRSMQRAEAFASRVAYATGFPVRAHAGYEALVGDPEVDVVYVATPHAQHAACAVMALSAGKAVLVEKPFALTRAEAERVVAEARRRRLFCMEAMWTRFLPHVVAARERIDAGRIGEVRLVQAEFGEHMPRVAGSRIFDPRLGGGALLDLGVYPVSFASMLLGAPEELAAVATLDESGVDLATAVSARYRGGALAVLSCSIETDLAGTAVVAGSEGRLVFPRRFWGPSGFVLLRGGEVVEEVAPAEPGAGLGHEADHVAACLRAGSTESPVLGLDESLQVMGILDEIRLAAGLELGS